jgi:hypothetical protein
VLAEFAKVLREVDGIALDETRSRDLIARVASEYERQPDDSGAADGVAQEPESTGGLSGCAATMAG